MPIGLQFEDAKEAQPRPVSEKVREGIERNDIYIGILTRRGPIQSETARLPLLRRIWAAATEQSAITIWSPPSWVVQESGYALGKGKQVLLLIEEGVDFPSSSLNADTEWIPFDRASIARCGPRLVAMINGVIGTTLPPVPAAIQVAPPEAPATLEKEVIDGEGTLSFDDIFSALGERYFQKADELFPRFLNAQPESTFKRWLPFFYLRLKAVKGDTESFRKLEAFTTEEPENVHAWLELANYYAAFQKHDQAAELLLRAVSKVPIRSRPLLTRTAAQELASAKDYQRALDLIVEQARASEDAEVRKLSLVELADIAKKQEERELEAAALEWALDVDPSDLSLRFRLAYLYGEMGKERLAVYHYKLRLAQGDDPDAVNNLGVAFSALKLKSKEIEMYQRASGANELAKANLSHAYVDRGFFGEAKNLAEKVIGGGAEGSGRDLAIGALSRIAKGRSNEEDTERKLVADAREESDFVARYAKAYISRPGQPISGVFETHHGRLAFKQDESHLTGEATFEEEKPSAVGLLVGLPGLATGARSAQIRTVKFDATIVGRSARLTVEVEKKNKGGLFQFPERSTTRGLIILAEDGRSFEVLEEENQKATIYRAAKAEL